MKIFLAITAVVLVCCLSSVENAEAIGFGISAWGTPKSGELKRTYESDSYSVADRDYKYDLDKKGIGLVMDTNLSKDSLFNYRLGISYEEEDLTMTENNAKPVKGTKFTVKGGVIENDFGFGIVRSSFLRLWLGPELRFSLHQRKFNANDNAGEPGKLTTFEAGIGPVVGLNFNIGSLITIAAKGGYIFDYGIGTRTRTTQTNMDDYVYGPSNYPFANLALIFRLGEQ